MDAPENLQIALGRIGEQSLKLTPLASQLLDVSRIEAGKLTIARVPTKLTVLLQNAITQAQIITQQQRLFYSLHLSYR
jgi:signal transduction histidine kinase